MVDLIDLSGLGISATAFNAGAVQLQGAADGLSTEVVVQAAELAGGVAEIERIILEGVSLDRVSIEDFTLLMT